VGTIARLLQIGNGEIAKDRNSADGWGKDNGEKEMHHGFIGEYVKAQIWANQMCTMEFLVYFAIIELYSESTHALYMELEKRGKLTFETMAAIRGWEMKMLEWVLEGKFVERVLNLLGEYVQYIDYGPWKPVLAHHIQRIALLYIQSTCHNFLRYFSKDAVIELFHYTFAPQNLATSNIDNNTLQYYYSLLVFLYDRLWKDERAMLERHLDLEDLIK
jgi:hypothetical protein